MKYVVYLFLIILLFARFSFNKPKYKDGDSVRIATKILSEPIVYDRQQYLKIKGLKTYLPKYPEIKYGDRIIIEGRVDKDKLKNPILIKIDNQDIGFLYKLRVDIISFYKKTLPEPYSSLVAGIVLGSKQIPEEFWTLLKKTGTAHVVVASGTNVTLVATFLISSLTYYFKRRTAVFISVAGIFLYVILSGFDAPIVRAAIMGSIVFFGQERGRVVNTWRVLIISGYLMLLIKPEWIMDLGFILSFVATMSLLIFQKRIDNYLKFIPNVFREGLSTSLAAQIGVAPIIFVTFGQFSLLSPVINALILWVIPYVMVSGAVAGIIGLVVPILGNAILYISFPLLLWFVKVITIFSF
jgi:competence protein ComEC